MGVGPGQFQELGIAVVVKLKSNTERTPMLSRPQFEPHRLVAGKRGANTGPILTPPSVSHLYACVTSRTRRWPGPRMRRLPGRYRGGALNRGQRGGRPWRHSVKFYLTPPQLRSQPSEENREVSPFLGCQLQQFLRRDGSSRRAKASFREVRPLPGLRTRNLTIPSGSPRARA